MLKCHLLSCLVYYVDNWINFFFIQVWQIFDGIYVGNCWPSNFARSDTFRDSERQETKVRMLIKYVPSQKVTGRGLQSKTESMPISWSGIYRGAVCVTAFFNVFYSLSFFVNYLFLAIGLMSQTLIWKNYPCCFCAKIESELLV